MSFRGKKLGVMVSCEPGRRNFHHALRVAETALNGGADVYFYCIDDAVCGVDDPRLQALKALGVKLYACAYSAQQRNIPLSEKAAFSGLTVVSDLIAATDKFASFNQRGSSF